MKKVFQLSVQFKNISTDLYFEDKETAENTAEFLKTMLIDKPNEELKIKASIHEVLSKESAAEYIKKGLLLSLFGNKN